MDAKVKTIEEEIKTLIADMNPMLLSISGIGVMTIAEILSECGDLNNFNGPTKLLTFASMKSQITSIRYCRNSGKIVRHGSPYLRNALMCCCMPVIHNNLYFKLTNTYTNFYLFCIL